jgi:hydroxymethylpyrimidine pyrophosphatase-like HAD family hydrolase
MGKPFYGELKLLESTIKWANGLEFSKLKKFVSKLDSPIYVVGSGGSLSACHFAVSALNNQGKFARAVTPLELFYLGKTLHNASILFITASGKNYDIRFAFKQVLEFEPKRIGVLTMREENPLAEKTKQVGIAQSFDFKIPTGKDGFLATNSLVAFYVLLNNSLGDKVYTTTNKSNELREKIKIFLNLINEDCTITVLHGGWSKSVAWDIESKCSEAGLTPTLISDFRNFGHGRHHWFSKRSNSAILALTNMADESLCMKTLDTLPNEIPKLILKSDYDGSISAIDQLVQSFEFIQLLGEKVGIDPGRPGVPAYGRKLYHLPYSKLLTKVKTHGLTKRAEVAIKRKLRIDDLSTINDSQLEVWKTSYTRFINQLNKARFGMILLDYDGTICSAEERYHGPTGTMAEKLLEILEKGYLIGVVTGRGKSVRSDLERRLPKKYWQKVLIGYYNGSDCGLLSNCELPDKEAPLHSCLEPVVALLEEIKELYGVDISERPNQITIKITDGERWDFIRNLVIQTLKTNRIHDIQILESSHSMDIIPNSASKLDILPFAQELLKSYDLSTDILTIGDKGQWSGNDFMLLDNKYGLSVEEVSSKLDSCWNLASLANRNTTATLEYLNCLQFDDNGIHFKISK